MALCVARPSEGSEMYCDPATDGTFLFVVTRRRSRVVGEAPSKEEGEASLVAIGLK
jgi:hypothetical protein